MDDRFWNLGGKPKDRRLFTREDIAVDAVITWDDDNRMEVIVISVSIAGAAFTSFEMFDIGQRITVSFKAMPDLDATVVGVDGFRSSCAFDEELTPVDIETIAGPDAARPA